MQNGSGSHGIQIVIVALLVASAFLGGKYIEQYQYAFTQGDQHIRHAHITTEASLAEHYKPPVVPKPFLKVPFPVVQPGVQQTEKDGVARVFTTDPYSKESWGWDESIPDCMAAKLNVTINQQLVTTDQVKPVIYGKDGPDIMTVRVSGTCGSFKGQTPFYLRKLRTDTKVWWEIMIQDAFYFTRRIWDSNNVSRIIDLGANVGVSLVYWATHFPKAQVIGVEPELNNFGISVYNAGHRKNVFLERAAVTTRNGWSKKSHIGDGLDWAWSEEPASGIESAESFKAVTMSHLLDKYDWDFVDILKVDVEGAERQLCQEILDGASWIQRVRCITLECHDRFFPNDPVPASTLCANAMEHAKFKFIGHFQIDNIRVWCRDEVQLMQPANRRISRHSLA